MSTVDMEPFRVNSHYAPPKSSRIEALCQFALEVLGAHMDNGFDANGESIDEEDHADGGLTIHTTNYVITGPSREVVLTNMPRLADVHGSLIDYAVPGYVALVSLACASRKTIEELQHVSEADQIIFQLPVPEEKPAAIYVGFSIEDTHAVSPEDAESLDGIKKVLQFTRSVLRHKAGHDPEVYEELYHSERPCVPPERAILEGLSGFGE